MGSIADHRGVAEDDPRNAGVIAFFRPVEPTRASIRATLAPHHAGRDEAALEAKVEALIAKIARGEVAPPPPLSQPLSAVADPVNGLSTHPDLVAELWMLDAALPSPCRWVFWGRPALVHPLTGVVFAVGIGSIGLIMRLPEPIIESADPAWISLSASRSRAPPFEIGAAGPDWRFVRWHAPVPASRAPLIDWARAAYIDVS